MASLYRKLVQTKNLILELVVAGFGVDALKNMMQGDYKTASAETIASAGIGYFSYLARKKGELTKDFERDVCVTVARIDQLNAEFRDKHNQLENY